MPTKVRAFVHEGKWHDIEVEDDVTAYVEYENGATGTFITATADAPRTNRFEFDFEGGQLVCVNRKQLFMTTLDTPIPPIREGVQKRLWSPMCHNRGGGNGRSEPAVRGDSECLCRQHPYGCSVGIQRQDINGLTLAHAMHLSL